VTSPKTRMMGLPYGEEITIVRHVCDVCMLSSVPPTAAGTSLQQPPVPCTRHVAADQSLPGTRRCCRPAASTAGVRTAQPVHASRYRSVRPTTRHQCIASSVGAHQARAVYVADTHTHSPSYSGRSFTICFHCWHVFAVRLHTGFFLH